MGNWILGLLFLFHALIPSLHTHKTTSDSLKPIIVDAADLVDRIPVKHKITDANRLGVSWLHDNFGLVMTTRTNYLKAIDIPEAGTWYLYARSQGSPNSTFRIAIDGEVIDHDIGNRPMHFERAGKFELEKGPATIRIMRSENDPVFDVLMLSKNPDLQESYLKNHEFNDDVTLLKKYKIPRGRVAKFGDVTGNGKMDFMIITRNYSVHMFDYAGNALWSYKAPEKGSRDRASFEAPGLMWDLDRDGKAEAINWRMIDGKEWLTVADGESGKIITKTPWPNAKMPHPYYNFRLAVGSLKPGYPENVIAFTDTGGKIAVTAYDAKLNRLWNHVEQKKKDHLGHYLYPVDLNDDGYDEVVVGSLVLNAAGNEIWNKFDLFYDHHDHADSYTFADLDHDGNTEVIAPFSDAGVAAMNGQDGKILWQGTAEHTQQIAAGYFLDDASGPQVAAGARIYGNRKIGEPYLWGQVYWFDNHGNFLSKWPRNPINGNPDFVKGDWNGDGTNELFWYKFKMTPEGKGQLYFPEPVYQMFDFMGDGAEEVVTIDDGWLKIYGSGNLSEKIAEPKRSPEYLKNKVANHSHY